MFGRKVMTGNACCLCVHMHTSGRLFQQAAGRSKATDMYAFGVTLWELFSGHLPYDTDVRPAHELIDELRDLLTDPDDPLRPDLQLVDPRVWPLLQVQSLLFVLHFCAPHRCCSAAGL